MTASEQLRSLMQQVARGDLDPESAVARIARFAVGLAMASEGQAVDGLTPLRLRMGHGRAKYPNGCTVLSLLDEAGELAHAVNKGEPVDRVRDELLDVAAVAMRLYLGEVDEKHDVVPRTQRALAELSKP